MTNPLLEPWTTPFEIPPFDTIADAHFAPAFEAAIAETRERVTRIATDPDAPDFGNTIEAFERSGDFLHRISTVFYNRAATDTNETVKTLQRDLSPKLSALRADIRMNGSLFARIEDLWQRRGECALTQEQDRVLMLTRQRFVRDGALLDSDGKARLKDILGRLAVLATLFSQNIQKDEEDWVLSLTEADVEGLPASLQSGLRGAAAERDLEGYALTLSRSLVVPFLQSTPRRDLREVAFRAWAARGASNPDTATAGIVREILTLRAERAALLGYDSYADYRLEPEMAKTPAAVRDLLMQVWRPARIRALEDQAHLTAMMQADGVNDELAPWDWRYYAAIRQKHEQGIDDAEVKQYLNLETLIEASFACATRLFGLTFTPLNAPTPHPDARAWEVTKNGVHLGVFIGDYFARSSKRSGAWCSRFRDQSKLDGPVSPIVLNVCNFAKPQAGAPALLTFDDARTLFHEFGHALHGLLSDVTYASISGTAVALDFVELPSQLYEHWLSTPQVLEEFARHAETGAPMPEDLRARLLAAETIDQGFATVEYVASALVDLGFHSGPVPQDPLAREAEILRGIGMPEAITMRHATQHFQHVFSGDMYASGYYSYMWSEVMDADAFSAFEESGDIFDPETARSLLQNIYSTGGSCDPVDLYTAFRGKMPSVDSLLQRRGFATAVV
ncbi:MAG: M3 family metallopeptidase [Pseudomonadota bacterium]